MRTIKFRAWDKDRKCMVLDQLQMDYQNDNHFQGFDNLYYEEGQIEDFELMQFTGLLDKNGKEIYEGDIFQSCNGRLWEIKHGEWKYWDGKQLCPMYGWYAFGLEVEGQSHAELPLYIEPEHKEVVGNIYQNPELINKNANNS